MPVLTAVRQAEAEAVLRAVALDRQAPYDLVHQTIRVAHSHATLSGMTFDVETPLRRYENLYLNLPGQHQQDNAVLALCAAEQVFAAVRADATPVIPGLWQRSVP